MDNIIKKYKNSLNLVEILTNKELNITNDIKNYTLSYLENINDLIFKIIVSKIDSNDLYTSKQNFDEFSLFLKKDLSKPILKIKLLKISSSINLSPKYGNFLVQTIEQKFILNNIQLLLDVTQIVKSLYKNQDKIIKNILNLEKKQLKILSKYSIKLQKIRKQIKSHRLKHETKIVPNLLTKKLLKGKSITFKPIFCRRKVEWLQLGKNFRTYCPTLITLSKPDKQKYKIKVITRNTSVEINDSEKIYYFDTDNIPDFFIQTGLSLDLIEKYVNNLLGDE